MGCPAWERNRVNQNCLSIIDGHTHSSFGAVINSIGVPFFEHVSDLAERSMCQHMHGDLFSALMPSLQPLFLTLPLKSEHRMTFIPVLFFLPLLSPQQIK